MHPQLSDAKREKCGDVIAALEECHRESYMTRILGGCNAVKDELTDCLKKERIDRSRQHAAKALEKRKTIEKRWKELEEEEYGPGGVLKNVVGKQVPKN